VVVGVVVVVNLGRCVFFGGGLLVLFIFFLTLIFWLDSLLVGKLFTFDDICNIRMFPLVFGEWVGLFLMDGAFHKIIYFLDRFLLFFFNDPIYE
jgi:hypothetical protein